MVRCVEFYDKLERDGNFCGLSGPSLSNIKFYKEIVTKLEDRGITEEFTIVNFSEGASRPLHKIKGDEDLMDKVLENIAGRIKVGGSITAGDVTDWINSAKQPEEKPDTDAPDGKHPPDIKKELSKDEYIEKYPETVDCLESGCTKIKKVRSDLHICEVTGMRPENMLGKFPVGCHKRNRDPNSTDRVLPEKSDSNSPPGESEDDTPGYQEILNKQLPQCRKRNCPELIDEEGEIMADCKVMARREDEGKPWRRNGCPMRPEVPPPKQKGTSGERNGTKRDPVKPPDDLPGECKECGKWANCMAAGPGEKGCVQEKEKPQPPPQREFLVVAGREDQELLQQLIDRGEVDKLEEAVQVVFEAGCQILRDKVEAAGGGPS